MPRNEVEKIYAIRCIACSQSKWSEEYFIEPLSSQLYSYGLQKSIKFKKPINYFKNNDSIFLAEIAF